MDERSLSPVLAGGGPRDATAGCGAAHALDGGVDYSAGGARENTCGHQSPIRHGANTLHVVLPGAAINEVLLNISPGADLDQPPIREARGDPIVTIGGRSDGAGIAQGLAGDLARPDHLAIGAQSHDREDIIANLIRKVPIKGPGFADGDRSAIRGGSDREPLIQLCSADGAL